MRRVHHVDTSYTCVNDLRIRVYVDHIHATELVIPTPLMIVTLGQLCVNWSWFPGKMIRLRIIHSSDYSSTLIRNVLIFITTMFVVSRANLPTKRQNKYFNI